MTSELPSDLEALRPPDRHQVELRLDACPRLPSLRSIDSALRSLLSDDTRYISQIAEIINEELKPEGVAVVCEAVHTCMTMRGVEQTNSLMVTSSVLGTFRSSEVTRAEFMALIRQSQ